MAAGYDTPEEAARGDIPPQYAKALSVQLSPDKTEALVVLATNEPPYTEPYEVVCYYENGRWEQGSGSGGLGLGWTTTSGVDADENLGVLRLAGEVPAGTEAVIVRWADTEYRVPVSSGHFFFTQWNVPAEFDDTMGSPQAIRYVQADGTEIRATADPGVERALEWLREQRRLDLDADGPNA